LEKNKLTPEEELNEFKKSILIQTELDQLEENKFNPEELKQLENFTNIYKNIDIIQEEIYNFIGRTDCFSF
jgi:hypothetical protein